MNIKQLSGNMSVGAQIEPNDLEELARRGFTDIVCNRPDAEHPGDPDSVAMASLASSHGLAFHYLPIVHTEPFLEQARKLAELTARADTKVFAYCRSGGRSANAWSLAQSAAI